MAKLTKAQIEIKAINLMQKHTLKVKKTEVIEEKSTKVHRVRVTLENGRQITTNTEDPKWEDNLDAQVNRFKNKA